MQQMKYHIDIPIASDTLLALIKLTGCVVGEKLELISHEALVMPHLQPAECLAVRASWGKELSGVSADQLSVTTDKRLLKQIKVMDIWMTLTKTTEPKTKCFFIIN